MKSGLLVMGAVGTTILAAAPLASIAQKSGDWTPTAAQIADIERRIELTGLNVDGPMSSFQRYYAGITNNGRRVIVAEYLGLMKMPRPSGTTNIVSYREMPAIGDGGCGVVNFEYDTDARTLSTPYCNLELAPPPVPPKSRETSGQAALPR